MEAVAVLGGRYRLMERLGAGGMSVVWRAEDEVLRRQVAVKVLSAQHLADASFRDRISAEARSAAMLSHPHVASVYDYGEATGADEPVPYVVMELLDGRSLAQHLSDGPLHPRKAMRVCSEVAAALAAAHAHGIVHRDVKPANVMITANGAKVVDFGIAAAAGEYTDLDTDAIMFGTPAYLAPERLDDGPVVPGTDVYAIGLLLYRTLTGALPWSVETTTQILRAHVYIAPQPLPRIVGVPASVHELYGRCLAKDPAERPSAAEVARVLAGAAGIAPPPLPDGNDSGVFVAQANADKTTQRTARRARRRRRLVPLVAVALALLVAVTLSFRLLGGPDKGASANPGATGAQGPTATAPGDTATAGTGSAGTGSTAPDGTGAANAGGTRPDTAPVPGQPVGGTTPPGSASPTASTSGPGVTAATVERTIDASPGGTVVASCTGTALTIISATAAEGYKAKILTDRPVVQFRFGTAKPPTGVRVKLRCDGGIPVGKVEQGTL